MSKVKVKLISDTLRTVMMFILKVFRGQILKRIDQVEDENLYKGVEISFIPIEEIVVALNDNDPDNQQQVKDITLRWINGPVSNLVGEIFEDLIDKNKNDHIKALLKQILILGVGTLKIYTDDQEKNNEQLNQLFDAFLESPESKELVLNHVLKPLLTKVINDEQVILDIIEIIEKALEGIHKNK